MHKSILFLWPLQSVRSTGSFFLASLTQLGRLGVDRQVTFNLEQRNTALEKRAKRALVLSKNRSRANAASKQGAPPSIFPRLVQVHLCMKRANKSVRLETNEFLVSRPTFLSDVCCRYQAHTVCLPRRKRLLMSAQFAELEVQSSCSWFPSNFSKNCKFLGEKLSTVPFFVGRNRIVCTKQCRQAFL